MFYALVNSEGTLVRYPYSATELKRDNPNISLPDTITDEVLAELNCFAVTPTASPEYDYTVNLETTAIEQDGQWVQQWISTPATNEEITERTAQKSIDVIRERNQLLFDSDWTQVPDSSADTALWAAYRQELRDITNQAGFPFDITWPTVPVNYRQY